MKPDQAFTKASAFNKAVQEALDSFIGAVNRNPDTSNYIHMEDDASLSEALASIQASTVKLLEGLRVKLEDKHVAGELNFASTVGHIDQLIKDLSNGE